MIKKSETKFCLNIQIPRILVGNKCDQEDVKVKTEDAQRWADDRGMPLFETSAKVSNL